MQFTITIDCESAAFYDAADPDEIDAGAMTAEIEACINRVKRALHSSTFCPGDPVAVLDSNGNTVGEAYLG